MRIVRSVLPIESCSFVDFVYRAPVELEVRFAAGPKIEKSFVTGISKGASL